MDETETKPAERAAYPGEPGSPERNAWQVEQSAKMRQLLEIIGSKHSPESTSQPLAVQDPASS